MNASSRNANGGNSWTAICAARSHGGSSRLQRARLALLGLLLLSGAGCRHAPTVVEVDRPVFIAPPAVCLQAVTWDKDAQPVTNGDLWASWQSRGWALAVAEGQMECVAKWSADIKTALEKK